MRSALLAVLLTTAAAVHAEESTPASASSLNSASTSEYRVRLKETESRVLFGLYGQMSQFARAGKNLMGYTLEGVADYAVANRLAVQLSLNQSLDMANGLSILFTGLRVGPAYALAGNFIQRSSNLNVNSQDTFSIASPDTSLLVADAGLDQYLFNGKDRIVPATGASLGIRYDRTFFRLRASVMARYGALVISEAPVSMMTVGAGLLIRF